MRNLFTEESLDRLRRFFLPVVVFNLLFLNFIKTNGYFAAASEVFIVFGLFTLVGAAYGLGFVYLKEKGRVLLLTGLLFFYLDVQFDWYNAPERQIWHILLISFIVLGVVSWLLVKYVEPVILPFFLVMLVVTLVKPYPKNLPLPHQHTLKQKSASASSNKLPIWIHIILDAQIGIEGIPAAFDPQRKLASQLVTDYTSRGFDVFGKAYSRANATNRSLRHLFTFSEEGMKNTSYTIKEAKNEYFKLLRQRGYQLHVYQTDRVLLCNPNKNKNKYVNDCSTYHHQDLRIVQRHPWGAWQKVSYLYGTYELRSRLLTRVHSLWNAFRRIVYPTTLDWGRSTLPLVGMEVLNWMNRELVHARRGHAYLVHVLLPHSPFAYDASCRLLPPQTDQRLTPEARYAKTYARYLGQVRCVHKKIKQLIANLQKANLYDDVNLIIHGDHGSRIATDDMLGHPPPTEKIATRSYFDHFSALFAVKRPHIRKGTYYSFMAPMDFLFASVVKKQTLPTKVPATLTPHIYLTPLHAPTRRLTMPSFPAANAIQKAATP